MTSCDVINQVNRYKIRLQSCHNDDVIIMKTLKKLSHINMTLDILKETRVGRSVNSLKSHEYYGKIAEEIVRKWKLLVPESSSSSSRKKKKHHRDVKYDVTNHDDVTTKHEDDDVTREYDPSGNWQMTKERNDDVSNDDITEYDPTQSCIQEEESIPHTNNKKLKKQRKSGNIGYQPATSTTSSLKQSYNDDGEDEPTPYDPSQQSSSSYKPYQPITSSKSYQPSSKQYKPSSKHHQREEYKPTNDEGGRYISDNSYKPSNNNGVTSSGYTSSKHTSSAYKPSSTTTTEEEEYNPTTTTDNNDNNNGYSPYQPTTNNKMKKKKKLYSMSDSEDDGDVIQEYLPTNDHQHDSGGYLPQQTKHSSTKHSHNSSKQQQQQQQVTSHRDNNDGKIREKKVKRKMMDDDVIREEPKKKQKTNQQQQNKKNKKISAPPSFEDFMAAPVVKKKKKKSIMTSQKSSSKESTKSSSSLKSSTSSLKSSTSAAPVDIKLDLPEIEKIYRPLHHAPLRRKPSTPTQQSHNPSGSNDMTDDMAAALHTQRNTGRMQIYSGGNKIHTVPAVYTLRAICIDYLRNNIDRLERINIPFDIIEPILEKCNPEQLDKIESFNNELVDDTHDMWKKHTMMEFKNKKPGHMQSWKELYWELHLQRDQKLEYLKSKIKSKTDKQKPLEKRTKMAFVGIGEAKAPRNVQRAQIKNGTGNAKYIKNVTSSSASSASDIKNVRHQIRMSVPVGRITANSVASSNSMQRQRSNKKPGKAPLMAKTLKSIGKLRR